MLSKEGLITKGKNGTRTRYWMLVNNAFQAIEYIYTFSPYRGFENQNLFISDVFCEEHV